MPHANIWIRKSNSAAWDSLEDKSAFINEMLKEHRAVTGAGADEPIKGSIEQQVVALDMEYIGEGGGFVTVKSDGRHRQLPIRAGKVQVL